MALHRLQISLTVIDLERANSRATVAQGGEGANIPPITMPATMRLLDGLMDGNANAMRGELSLAYVRPFH